MNESQITKHAPRTKIRMKHLICLTSLLHLLSGAVACSGEKKKSQTDNQTRFEIKDSFASENGNGGIQWQQGNSGELWFNIVYPSLASLESLQSKTPESAKNQDQYSLLSTSVSPSQVGCTLHREDFIVTFNATCVAESTAATASGLRLRKFLNIWNRSADSNDQALFNCQSNGSVLSDEGPGFGFSLPPGYDKCVEMKIVGSVQSNSAAAASFPLLANQPWQISQGTLNTTEQVQILERYGFSILHSVSLLPSDSPADTNRGTQKIIDAAKTDPQFAAISFPVGFVGASADSSLPGVQKKQDLGAFYHRFAALFGKKEDGTAVAAASAFSINSRRPFLWGQLNSGPFAIAAQLDIYGVRYVWSKVTISGALPQATIDTSGTPSFKLLDEAVISEVLAQ